MTPPAKNSKETFTVHPNTGQAAVIRHGEGPLLVVAGPGAGKTWTLVERVVYLIREQGALPEQILVATFTEKAARELVTRISNRLLELDIRVNLHEMYLGTLHSIFLRLLEDHREFTRLKRSFRLLDQFDQQYLIYNRIRDYLGVEEAEALIGEKGNNWYKAKQIMALVNKVGEECLGAETLCRAEEPEIRATGRLYQIYEQQLAEDNALDFSFIQVETLRLLNEHPAILAELQRKIRFLMIDEYQDTNTVQERILLLLAAAHHNICVVGDDDQGLYRFRGATIRNILEFPNNFPAGTCRQITIDTNYRSHPGIIDFYNRWMDRCRWAYNGAVFRFPKTIRPQEGDFPVGPSVIRVGADGTLLNYYEEVLAFLRRLEKQGVLDDYNQVAFLFRSVKNENVTGLADFLEANGIPVFSPRSALFFQREEIRLLLGAIVFIFPNLLETLRWSDDAYLGVWEYYEECKKRFADALRQHPKENEALLQWCRRRARAHLTLEGSTNYGFAALIYQLLEYPLFARHLDADLKGRATTQRAAYNIALLTRLFFKFEYLHGVTVLTVQNLDKHLRQLFNHFLRFVYEGGIEEYENFDEYAPSGCVSFLTIHQAKGLEFPVVLVGSLGSVPRKQFTEADRLLQEKYYHKPPFEPIEETKYFDFWRLYYTAFSRAQNLLVLTANEKREGRGREPSRYFLPVYDPLPAWDDPGVDLRNLDLKAIRPMRIKKEYSFTSHVLLYENCPAQYKFYKELEFVEVRTGATMAGQLLHQTIEDMHKAVLRGEPHRVTEENIETWFQTNYHYLVKQLRSYLHAPQRRALLQQVLRYRERMQDRWHLIREAEVDVSLVKEDYILKGTIDLIQGEADTVELVDFKSGDKPDVNDPDPHTRRQLDGYRRQLEVYAHLVEERTGYRVSKMHLYYPKEEAGSPYVTFRKDHSRIQQTIDSFDRVVARIEDKNFDNAHILKSEKQCGDCDMRYYCNPRQYSQKA